jgi:predicted permease
MATGGFAATLELRARIGRLPGPDDALDPRVTAISERLWREAFGRDPAAVGSTLLLNGAKYTVIGVIAGGYHGASFAEDSDLIVPVEAYADAGQSFVMMARGSTDVLSDRRIGLWNTVLVRLAPGWTPEDAQAQLRAAWDRALEANPMAAPGRFGHPVPTVRAGVGLASMGPNVAKVTELLTLLGGVVAFLLLLACANAANLLLVRATARRGELAVMRAIGAGRAHLAAQVLIEALLLAVTGAVVGLALAFGALRVFRGERLMPWMPPLAAIDMSRTVVLFSLALSLLAAILCGVLPAVLSVRKLGWISASSTGTRASARTSRGLLAFQVAVSSCWSSARGSCSIRCARCAASGSGGDPESVLEASIDPSTQHYDDAAARALYQDVLEAARALPSVSVAALARWPVLGGSRSGSRARPEGTDRDDPRAVSVWWNVVSPGFLSASGVELIEGRDFLPSETWPLPGTPGVAILSAAAAAHIFPEGTAVGRRIDVGVNTPRIPQVVGWSATPDSFR